MDQSVTFRKRVYRMKRSQQCNLKDVRDRKILHTEFFQSSVEKIQYIITEAVLGRKSMKKFAVTDQKIFPVYKAFDRKK